MFEDMDEAQPQQMPPPDGAPMSQVTVQQMDKLMADLMEQRRKAEEAKKAAALVNTEVARLEGQVVMALHSLDRENYKCAAGQVSLVRKWRVSNPVTDEDKVRLFEHFRERGIFLKMATVNSNSLNSLFLADWEAAKERGEGMDFKMPGVGEPKLHEMLQVRKA